MAAKERAAKQDLPEIAEHISELEAKNLELISILKRRFLQENNTLSTHIAKIFTIQSCMEETLATFVAEVQLISENAKLKGLADKLENLSNELKAVAVDALRCTSQPKKPASHRLDPDSLEESKISAEEAKNEEEEREDSCEDSFDNEAFNTANEEEISKNMNNSSSTEEADYRLALPAKRSNISKVSAWQVIKDMIGKDLTHFAVPGTTPFCYPSSVLYRADHDAAEGGGVS